MFSRRRFLQSSAVAASSSLVGCASISSGPSAASKPGARPRNIIHLVSDGTSSGTVACANHLSELKRGKRLTWLDLYGAPGIASGMMDMRSLNSLVTDSSAASSSWGSGVRIINGMVNQTGDGTPLTTLYELFAQQGWKRGLVTTTEITHATPAGFATSTPNREKATIIAAQYLDRGVEVLLGGGSKYFDTDYRLDKRDLRVDYRKAGYTVMATAEELSKAPVDKRWLGIFSRSHLPFDIDRPNDPKAKTVPSLAQMTTAALGKLSREDHFILQVEGGRIDHAAHNGDAVSALHELISFDEALDVCLAFQKKVPDTLIVVTTDHGTANIALNGTGDEYGQSLWNFRKITSVQASFPEILKRLRKTPPPDPAKPEREKDDVAEKAKEKAKPKEQKDREKAEQQKKDDDVATQAEMVQIIREMTGYKPSDERVKLMFPFMQKRGSALYEGLKSETCALGQLMANYHSLFFTGGAHTSDHVSILAVGPGAERFQGFIKNTDVFYNYLALAKIDFRNPQEPVIGQPELLRMTENTAEYKLG